jgi:hypothetical protein
MAQAKTANETFSGKQRRDAPPAGPSKSPRSHTLPTTNGLGPA